MKKLKAIYRRKVTIYGKPRYQKINSKGQIVDNQNISRTQKEDRAKKAKTVVKPRYGFEGDQKKHSA